MPETTPLIKAALNLRGGAGFDVYAYNAWLKGWEEIDFETVSNVAVGEIQQVIQQIILCMR